MKDLSVSMFDYRYVYIRKTWTFFKKIISMIAPCAELLQDV